MSGNIKSLAEYVRDLSLKLLKWIFITTYIAFYLLFYRWKEMKSFLNKELLDICSGSSGSISMYLVWLRRVILTVPLYFTCNSILFSFPRKTKWIFVLIYCYKWLQKTTSGLNHSGSDLVFSCCNLNANLFIWNENLNLISSIKQIPFSIKCLLWISLHTLLSNFSS